MGNDMGKPIMCFPDVMQQAFAAGSASLIVLTSKLEERE